MKILIVNAQDIKGGAARAAYRLHESLTLAGIDSNMLVQIKDGQNSKVTGPSSKLKIGFNLIKPTLDSLPLMNYKNRMKVPFSTSSFSFFSLVEKINSMKPDLVHLHWVCRGMFTIDELQHIKAPIVWSLHDMWPFTGGCHYDEECGLYRSHCGRCPILNSRNTKDISYKIFKRKLSSYSKIPNITIIGLSRWLENEAKKSLIFKDRKVVNLPNPINTKQYKPLNKSFCRDLWGLPRDKKLVLFGAMSATGDTRKGYIELVNAISELTRDDLEFVIFGSEAENDSPSNMHFVGSLNDDTSLISLYNAADLFILPSKQENLANTVLESLSCGTPIVAFNIGGNSDMVEHCVNGYLAKPFDALDLAKGINWCLDENYEIISENARLKAESFSYENVAKDYIKLYKEILG